MDRQPSLAATPDGLPAAIWPARQIRRRAGSPPACRPRRAGIATATAGEVTLVEALSRPLADPDLPIIARGLDALLAALAALAIAKGRLAACSGPPPGRLRPTVRRSRARPDPGGAIAALR